MTVAPFRATDIEVDRPRAVAATVIGVPGGNAAHGGKKQSCGNTTITMAPSGLVHNVETDTASVACEDNSDADCADRCEAREEEKDASADVSGGIVTGAKVVAVA